MRPQHQSPGRTAVARGERGFTLLELIVVLLIAGWIVSLVIPSVSATLESERLRSATADVRSTFTLARTLAASSGRERAVIFSLDRGAYEVGGKERQVPEGVMFDSIRTGGETVDHGEVRIMFFPDGSAEEAEVVLASRGGGRMRVTLDPLTGIAEAGT
jgi:general secretion pathway protein H